MRKRVQVIAILGLVLLAFSTPEIGNSTAQETQLEGDAKAGESKAKEKTCAACHGNGGVSTNTLWPNLAGQQEGYLVKSIKDFRDGIRVEATMAPFIEGLTDQEIADLAAYYNGLSPCP